MKLYFRHKETSVVYDEEGNQETTGIRHSEHATRVIELIQAISTEVQKLNQDEK